MKMRTILSAALVLLAACGGQPGDELSSLEDALTIPAANIPGKVEAENFKVGSEGGPWSDTTPTNLGGEYRPGSGVDLQSTSDTGGGYNVGWIAPGEYLTYALNVTQSGTYQVSARVASNVSGTKSFQLLVDGKGISSASFTQANGWQSWMDVGAGTVTLQKGAHTLKFVAVTGGFNLNFFSLTETEGGSSGETLMGASIKGTLFSTLGRDKVPVTRVYLRQLPAGSKWSDFADLAAAKAHSTKAIWVSFKEDNPALVDAFLDTVPSDLGRELIVTYFHEPEDNLTTDAERSAYRATWQKMGPIIRQHGMTPALILMRYTLSKSSGRNWKDYYAPGSVDLLGWDSYRKGDPGTLDVSSQLDPIIAVSESTGLPWGIGETGSTSERYSDQDTARWAAALRAYGTEHGASVLCWWDQDTYKLDQTTASAWLD